MQKMDFRTVLTSSPQVLPHWLSFLSNQYKHPPLDLDKRAQVSGSALSAEPRLGCAMLSYSDDKDRTVVQGTWFKGSLQRTRDPRFFFRVLVYCAGADPGLRT